MSEETLQVALLVVAIAFVLLITLSGVLPAFRARRAVAPVRTKISEALSIASDESRTVRARVDALVLAGRSALTELNKPRVAAHHAEWAHRLDPRRADVIELAIDALDKAHGHLRLERLLWTSLDASEGEVALRSQIIDALASLYEEHMHRPERARALRRLLDDAVRGERRADDA